jgi:predicted MPP superfamily phosphohydrolase
MVVATHPPDVTTELDGMRVDLHLAGHTHGGQIALPFLGPPVILSRLPTKYARGLFRYDDHWLDVCAGLGMEGNHAPRIRFLCPPEIVLLRLVGGGPARASSE